MTDHGRLANADPDLTAELVRICKRRWIQAPAKGAADAKSYGISVGDSIYAAEVTFAAWLSERIRESVRP